MIQKLEDQKALFKDPAFTKTLQRWVKKGDEKVLTERTVPVRPWWRVDEKGQTFLFIRLGYRTLEFEKGKAGIVVGEREKIPVVIDTLIEAIRAGEVDALLEPPSPPSRKDMPVRAKKIA
jgi:hypothetical protein